MHRPWQIAVVFVAALAVVLAALGWTSHQVLRLDRQATQEETVRLALWRMESALMSMVAQEAARPYFEYIAFYSPDRAYARMYNWDVGKGELFVPSPILVETSPYIRLHFQFGPDGALTSPQAPAEAPGQRPPVLAYATRDQIETAAARLAQLKPLVDMKKLAAELPGPAERPLPAPALAMGANLRTRSPQPANPKTDAQNYYFQQEDQVNQPAQQQGTIAQRQVQRNIKEYEAREQTYQQMAGNTSNNPLTNFDNNAGINRFNTLGEVREGVMKAVWLGGELVLARRVAVGGREYIQGAWLDWPAIRQWLLESVKDLVPQADLAPVRPDTPAGRSGWRSTDIGSLVGREGYVDEPGRLLATLPVRLVPGAVAPETEEGLSPLRLSLIVAWACVLLAGVAVVVLLWGTVALSERRAAFVSAVTHELRTPLTTFRMYSEMLAGGMVADEAKRRRYLDTLRIEADRLVHLVENVLAYARLERGRARGRTETVRLADLVGRIGPRLAERAGQAGFEFVVEGAGADAAVRADPSAVEQILFNLVDNACKYAAGAADKRIHLVAVAAGDRAALEVCDHGPGLSARDARRLFRPFSKSARQAAHSAPGVGLGLALSRRLAREMGGDLTLIPRPDDGACFALFLPQG